jgi:hypothetical protein
MGDPSEAPTWGGARRWTARVDMTNPADSKEHPAWSFTYYYNADKSAELYHHGEGQGDEICGQSTHPNPL